MHRAVTLAYRPMEPVAGAFAFSRRPPRWHRDRAAVSVDAARVRDWEAEGGALAGKVAGPH